jgi:hypothetical protein
MKLSPQIKSHDHGFLFKQYEVLPLNLRLHLIKNSLSTFIEPGLPQTVGLSIDSWLEVLDVG